MLDLNMRVLVIDDMMTTRKLVSRICKEIGFTDVTEASDGVQAWEAIDGATPKIGLVLSDWDNGNANEMDLLKKIRSDSRFKDLPFLMITAEANPLQIVKALKSGVDNYVIKPFSAPILKEKLEFVHKKTNHLKD